PPLERPAADGAGERSVRVDDHPRPRFPRRRALRRRNRHHRHPAVAVDGVEDAAPDLHQISAPAVARIARMIASGVAGAFSRGITAGLRLMIASVIAEKTEIASISGGSPTAFDR